MSDGIMWLIIIALWLQAIHSFLVYRLQLNFHKDEREEWKRIATNLDVENKRLREALKRSEG